MDTKYIRRILVIGDDAGRRSFLCRALGSHYPVMTASGDDEGLAVAEKTLPDAIVVDVAQASQIAQRAAARGPCEERRLRHVPVVAIAPGRGLSDAQFRFLEQLERRVSGLREVFLEESVTPEWLRQEIQRLIGNNPPEYCTRPSRDDRATLPTRMTPHPHFPQIPLPGTKREIHSFSENTTEDYGRIPPWDPVANRSKVPLLSNRTAGHSVT